MYISFSVEYILKLCRNNIYQFYQVYVIGEMFLISFLYGVTSALFLYAFF